MTSLGFENYAEALKIYLARYREVSVCVYRHMNFCANLCSQTLVARGEHQRPMTGGTTLNSSGGAQENTMEPTETSSTNDYAYVAQEGEEY
jgi:nuclear transcription Y subunit beta